MLTGRAPGFWVACSLHLKLAGGPAWGLALMRPDRWRGIVGSAPGPVSVVWRGAPGAVQAAKE